MVIFRFKMCRNNGAYDSFTFQRAAYADLDNDGDLDLVVNNLNKQAGIYRNETDKSISSHYLKIRLRGNNKNTFGLGAKLWCYTKDKTQFLEQMPTRGYQSSVSEILHFGLGRFTVADSLKIKWPGGELAGYL